MIWFTSDTHWWHKAIRELCGRPWASTEEMNQGLIENWNSEIKPEDQVYHLGDFAFAGTGKCKEIFDQLNGRKYLVRGNHDGKTQCKQAWEWVRDYYELRVQFDYETDEGEVAQYVQLVVLCHFPILSWNNMAHGSWHLHGHCHGSLPDTGGLRWDVGVDNNEWYPCSIDQIRQKMALRTVVPVGDHHK